MQTTFNSGQLVNLKELATALNRSMPYVYAMKHKGCPMKSGRITLARAMRWLEQHPPPLSKKG
jgi:phage terminase Nu1 subunit (DNA packaging protein)